MLVLNIHGSPEQLKLDQLLYSVLPQDLCKAVDEIKAKFKNDSNNPALHQEVIDCIEAMSIGLELYPGNYMRAALLLPVEVAGYIHKNPAYVLMEIFKGLKAIYNFEEAQLKKNLTNKILAAKEQYLTNLAKRAISEKVQGMAKKFLSKALDFMVKSLLSINAIRFLHSMVATRGGSNSSIHEIAVLNLEIKFGLPTVVLDALREFEVDQHKFHLAKMLGLNAKQQESSAFIRLYDDPEAFIREFEISEDKNGLLINLFGHLQKIHQYALQSMLNTNRTAFIAAMERFKAEFKPEDQKDAKLLLSLLAELLNYIDLQVFNQPKPQTVGTASL